MKPFVLAILTFVVVGFQAPAQDEEPSPKERELLARWDQLSQKLKKVKSRLERLQIRYNGAATDEKRVAIEKEYDETTRTFVAEVKTHLKAVADFLEDQPKNRLIRERRARDEAFIWMDPGLRANDCMMLFEATKNPEFLRMAAKYHEEGYDYGAACTAWKQLAEVNPTFDDHYDYASALMNDLRFDDAVRVFTAAKELVKEEGDERKITSSLEIATRYAKDWPREQRLRDEAREKNDLPVAEIVTAKGTIIIELFEDQAPNTVANFITLAENKFYDDGRFHRCIANFMIQGGDPMGTGVGGPGYNIPDECDGENIRLHYPGSVSMAKTAGQPNSGGSQFFITSGVTGPLNGRHTVFGRVLQGKEVSHVRGIDVSKAAHPIKIESIRILKKRDHPYTFKKVGE